MDQVSSFFDTILHPETGPQDNPSKPKNDAASWHESSENLAKFFNDANSNDKQKKEQGQETKSVNTLLADKLMEKILSLVVPVNLEEQAKLSDRIKTQKTRAPLSMNQMSRNAMLMTLRLSGVFVTIDGIEKFFNWDNNYLTVGVLLICTHLILKPHIILALPAALVIVNIMVPHYMETKPPDGSLLDHIFFKYNPIPAEGKALFPAEIPKPVPELSGQFILNFTDLQNRMEIYIALYDVVVLVTRDFFYFASEDISSIVYVGLLLWILFVFLPVSGVLFLLFNSLFLKPLFITALWSVVTLSHPVVRNKILAWYFSEETRLSFTTFNNRLEEIVLGGIIKSKEEESIAMRKAEIFELQKYNRENKTWSLVGFTNNTYTLNCPERKSNNQHYKFAEEGKDDEQRLDLNFAIVPSLGEVQAPLDWDFTGQNWSLDLNVNEWVRDRLINDLVFIDEDEKWVYDIDEQGSNADVFRRRRWLHICERYDSFKNHDNDENSATYDYLYF